MPTDRLCVTAVTAVTATPTPSPFRKEEKGYRQGRTRRQRTVPRRRHAVTTVTLVSPVGARPRPTLTPCSASADSLRGRPQPAVVFAPCYSRPSYLGSVARAVADFWFHAWFQPQLWPRTL